VCECTHYRCVYSTIICSIIPDSLVRWRPLPWPHWPPIHRSLLFVLGHCNPIHDSHTVSTTSCPPPQESKTYVTQPSCRVSWNLVTHNPLSLYTHTHTHFSPSLSISTYCVSMCVFVCVCVCASVSHCVCVCVCMCVSNCLSRFLYTMYFLYIHLYTHMYVYVYVYVYIYIYIYKKKKNMARGRIWREVVNSPPRRGMGHRCAGWWPDWGQWVVALTAPRQRRRGAYGHKCMQVS
jgi:hypothetical protein